MTNPFKPRLPLPGEPSIVVRRPVPAANAEANPSSTPPQAPDINEENQGKELIGVPPSHIEPPGVDGSLATFELVQPASPASSYAPSHSGAGERRSSPFKVALRNPQRRPMVRRARAPVEESSSLPASSASSVAREEVAIVPEVQAQASTPSGRPLSRELVSPLTTKIRKLDLDAVAVPGDASSPGLGDAQELTLKKGTSADTTIDNADKLEVDGVNNREIKEFNGKQKIDGDGDQMAVDP